MVFLKLQSYRQVSLATRKNAKLSARFYGPFEVLDKIGKVAYRLKLPSSSRIHPVFHVSVLKQKLGDSRTVLETLPTVSNDDALLPVPQAVLDQRKKKGRNEVLIHWRGLSPAESTWESQEVIKEQFPEFTLEDKCAL
ncbi:hypothetical protein LWI29_000459 [Acer saccharum]|uniref:Chromo domain-containing protein n=1 Tax=Acer saccharum TaxID=4024 RepID=A0AA39W410_ACESA|nr:hypothetical protein LWI29_000459 [Acer saccharum]